MKEFTVKDFILYNNPCFVCNEFIQLQIRVTKKSIVSFPNNLKPSFSNNKLEINLSTKYYNILNLSIDLMSNKIISNNINELQDFLFNHELNLQSVCLSCGAYISSHFLQFDLKNGFVKPVGIAIENFVLESNDGYCQYDIYSSFLENKSKVQIRPMHQKIIELDIPLFSLSKFKNKEKLLEKFKIIMLFS